jgi:hypothetical protein
MARDGCRLHVYTKIPIANSSSKLLLLGVPHPPAIAKRKTPRFEITALLIYLAHSVDITG